MSGLSQTLKTLPQTLPWLHEVEFFHECASTNDEAIRLGRGGAPGGSLVVAEAQSAGRGRLQRPWESAPGKGLYFSLVWRPALPASSAPLITLAAGLGVGRALKKLGIKTPVVKWPNDIWLEGKKVCGILTELFTKGEKVDFVVIGVGLNVSQSSADFSPDLRNTAGSLHQVTGRDWDLGQLLAVVLEEIERALQSYLDDGPSALRQAWVNESNFIKRKIRWEEAGKSVTGKAVGLALDGQLEVENETGEKTSILAGDVYLLD